MPDEKLKHFLLWNEIIGCACNFYRSQFAGLKKILQAYWKSHIILTLLAKQDLLLLATTYLILVKSWRRGQFYFTPLDTLVFLCP